VFKKDEEATNQLFGMKANQVRISNPVSDRETGLSTGKVYKTYPVLIDPKQLLWPLQPF